MTIAYSHWSTEAPQPQLPAARRGMAAYRDTRPLAEPAPHRWKSVAVTVAGHGLILYVLFFVAVVAPKQVEMQSITVSITQTQAKKPEPVPVPKLEKAPEILQ